VSACPSCKRRVSSSDVVCPHCRHALDPSVVAPNDNDASIVDDDVFGSSKGQRDLSFGDDAVIFGDGVGDYDAFDAVDTGFVQKELTNARIFVGGAAQNLLRADAIPERVPESSPDAADLTPYEVHVLQFVNGKRPVGRIRRKSGMEDPDVKLALAMLADKRLIRLIGHVSEDRKLAAREKRRSKLKAEKSKRRDGRERSSSSGERKSGRVQAPPPPAAGGLASGKAAQSKSASRETVHDEKTGQAPAPMASADRKRPVREVRAPTRITRSEVADETPFPSTIPALQKGSAKRSSDERSAKVAKAKEAEAGRTTAKLAPQLRSLDVGFDDDVAGAFAGDTEVVPNEPPVEKRPAEARDDDEADAFDEESPPTEVLPSLESAARAGREKDRAAAADVDEQERAEPALDDEGEAFDEEAEAPDLDGEGIDDDDVDAGRDPDHLAEQQRDDEDGGRIHREVTLVKAAPLAPAPESDLDDEGVAASAHDDEGPHSLLSERDVVALSDEGLVGPVPLGDDVHDVPTGPVELKVGGPSSQHGRGFDDSVLPTGEVPLVSLSGFAGDDPSSPREHAIATTGAAPPPLPDDDDGADAADPGADFVQNLPSGFFTPLPVPAAPAALLLPLPGTVTHSPSTTNVAPPVVVSATPAVAPATPVVMRAPIVTPLAPALPGQSPPGSRPLPPTKPLAGQPVGKAAQNDAELDDAIADDSDEGEVRDAGAAPVSYENRRKAEKIFEQAERDAAAGRFAGARMNAKLAMIYDPSLKRYRELYELWGSPSVQGAHPANLRKDVALFQEAKDLELKGDYRGAVKLLEQALKLNPSGAPILNLLGVIQATRLKEYRKASDNLMKACELEPGNRSFKNNLGKVLGMAEDMRDKRVVENDDGSAVKVKKMRPKLF
jgi:hypothetical protein